MRRPVPGRPVVVRPRRRWGALGLTGIPVAARRSGGQPLTLRAERLPSGRLLRVPRRLGRRPRDPRLLLGWLRLWQRGLLRRWRELWFGRGRFIPPMGAPRRRLDPLGSGCRLRTGHGPSAGRALRRSPAAGFLPSFRRARRRGRCLLRSPCGGLGFLVAGPPIRTAVRLGSLGPTLARRVRLVRLRGIGWLVALRGGLPRRGRDQRFLVHVDDRVVGPSRRVFGPYGLHPVDPLAGA